METKETSIEVINLTKEYGKSKAINKLNFNISSGEIIGFLGPNGAGKTTTMRILAGLVPATSGIARIHGISVSRSPQAIKKILSFMPENNPLPEDVRVHEYLRHRAALKGISGKELKTQIEHVVETCELTRTAENKLIGKLSKGYRQRVGIADSLLGHPKVIIMDEPTIGLDPHQILSFRKLIESLKNKMTVVISSHILPEIEACCDRIIIINKGHIVAQGSSKELRSTFIPEYTYDISIKAPEKKFTKILSDLDPDHELLWIHSDDDDFISFRFKTKKSPEFGEELTQAIQSEPHWKLRQIHRMNPSLEEIFIRATRQNWKTPTV